MTCFLRWSGGGACRHVELPAVESCFPSIDLIRYFHAKVKADSRDKLNLYRDADLAEMRAAFEMAVGVGRLVEREDAVDHGMETVDRHRAIHRFEHLARADHDPLDARVLEEQRHRIDLARAGENADQADD